MSESGSLPVDPDRRPLIVLLGPTASGKTDLAIRLAQAELPQFGGIDIISADSRQIYRFMDIGTAKPTPAQRAAVPHHLIDVVTPDQSFTLAQYQRAAREAIDAIHARGGCPLLVGGTGQYITAVIEGWSIPEVPPQPDLRAALEAFAAQHGALALHDRLREVDPQAAGRIDHRNVRRVIRALEVYEATGTPISVLQQRTPPPYAILQIGLTMPRDLLYARADARIEAMIAAGLENEVRDLVQRGYTWDCPAMSGLGYGQWRAWLESCASREDAIAAIRRETRAYIRRQYTWFNGHANGLRWLDSTGSAWATAQAWLTDWLARRG